MSQKNSIASASKKTGTHSDLPVFNRSGTYVVDKKDQNAASSSIQIDNEKIPPSAQKKPLSNQNAINTHSKLSRIQSLPIKSQSNSANSQKSNASSIETTIIPKQTRTSNTNLSLIKEKKRIELKDQSSKLHSNAQSDLNFTSIPNKSIDLIIKNARKSGQLNISDFGLIEIPAQIWRINTQDALAVNKSASIDNDDNDFKWWDQIDLNKLIAASNKIKIIPKDVQHLSTLVTLDVHDNLIESIDESISELQLLLNLNISHNQLTLLPEGICKLRLVNFNASYNKLNQMPKNIGYLNDLEDLDLSHNSLTAIPKSFGWLIKLLKLNLSSNSITQLIPEAFYSTSLKIIDLSENQIQELPNEIGELSHLEQLFCRQNKLKKLPKLVKCCKLKDWDLSFNAINEIDEDSFTHLVSLVNFNLRDNQISVLPKTIKEIQTLERLDLSNNNLSNLPYELAGIESLKQILLVGNTLRSIRRDIINRGTVAIMKHLKDHLVDDSASVTDSNKKNNEDTLLKTDVVKSTKVFDLSCRKLTNVTPNMITFCKQCTALVFNLSKNQLKDLPNELEDLNDQLHELNLSFNLFSTLPQSMFSLNSLTLLDLRGNQLTSISLELNRLKSLRELIISDNKLTELGDGIYELPILENLFANNNRINFIDPLKLRKMKFLYTLNLQNNDLSQIPHELGKVEQIKSLQLEGNPFKVPRPQIIQKGTAAILEYLRGRLTES